MVTIVREKTITIHKNEGETPLECLDRFRIEQPLYKDAILSYAGRLDPMAEGALLVLVDEENKKRLEYLEHDKTYEVEILFGISSDTGDILGIVSAEATHSPAGPDHSKSANDGRTEGDVSAHADILQSFVGTFTQTYPHYSSKTVKGKPLFQWAREGRLGEIEIPEKTSKIYSVKSLGGCTMAGGEILSKATTRIAKVKGDFRQKASVDSWDKCLKERLDEPFLLIRLIVSCSSGTYMRTLAEMIGKRAATPSLAWSIKRLHIKPK